MQPVNATALSASEPARSLKSGNKGKAGGMVTFRTGFGLNGVWLERRRDGSRPRNGGAWLMSTIRPFFTRKRYQAHAISLLMCAHPCLFRLVDEVLFLFHFQRFGFVRVPTASRIMSFKSNRLDGCL